MRDTMKKTLLTTFLLLTSFSASATLISGSVTTGTGNYIKIIDPTGITVGNNNYDTLNLYGFDEDQNFTLTEDLDINTGTGVISAGTIVASHYIFFDPKNSASQIGTVSFDSEILGIITNSTKLEASAYLGHSDVTYLGGNLLGLESNDSAAISLDLYSLTVNWTASTPGDYLRVITAHSPLAAVPVPAAAWLFGTGLLGLFSVSRARSKAS